MEASFGASSTLSGCTIVTLPVIGTGAHIPVSLSMKDCQSTSSKPAELGSEALGIRGSAPRRCRMQRMENRECRSLLGDESARNKLQVDLATQKMLDEMLENEKESVAYGEIVNEH